MAEEKLRAGEVFASYRRQGTPRGLQKGVENIFCISCLGLINAREPSGRYSLLAILAAYGETAPWCSVPGNQVYNLWAVRATDHKQREPQVPGQALLSVSPSASVLQTI